MAYAEIDYDEGQLARIERQLQMLFTRLRPTGIKAFLESDVKNWVQARALARFGAEGDDATGPWAPLRPSTQGIREELNQRYGWGIQPHTPINVRTGTLKRTVTTTHEFKWDPPNGGIIDFPGRSMSRETEGKLFRAQFGGISKRTGNTFPPRPVLALSEMDSMKITQMAEDYFFSALVGT